MPTDVSAPAEPAAAAPAEPTSSNKRGNPTRTMVLVVILIIAAAALFFDRRAQSQAMSDAEELDAMKKEAMTMGKELPTKEQVREHIGREPDEEYDLKEVQNTSVEEYHYRVPWRTTVLYVYYRTQPDVRFDAVSVNQALTADDL